MPSRTIPVSTAAGRGKAAVVHLSITTRRSSDGTVNISPRGEIDVANADEILGAVVAVLADSLPKQICLDLWQVTLVDSAGIGAFVACFKAAAASGVRVVAANPNRTVYRALWIAGLVDMLGSPSPGP